MGMSRDMNTAEGTGTSRNCSAMRAKVANELATCVLAPRCYILRMEPPLRSRFVGRATGTMEKRIPINYAGCTAVYFWQIGLKVREFLDAHSTLGDRS